ncbi:MAG TPA: hypothetical protein VMU36_02035 [Spirochaetia bacterium]|nr:hypothetical protein [Spirochaetia bacterium]
MTWLVHLVVEWVGAQMEAARVSYGVNPVVFLVILLGSSPVFYYSIYRMVRALAGKRMNEAAVWSMVFLASTAAPYLYVLVAGRNLPWWVYIIIGLILAQGVWSLVRRLRNKPQPDRR